jgi:hypothetical protein
MPKCNFRLVAEHIEEDSATRLPALRRKPLKLADSLASMNQVCAAELKA